MKLMILSTIIAGFAATVLVIVAHTRIHPSDGYAARAMFGVRPLMVI